MKVQFGIVGATASEIAFKRNMVDVRVAVERNYKDLKQMLATNDYFRLLKA